MTICQSCVISVPVGTVSKRIHPPHNSVYLDTVEFGVALEEHRKNQKRKKSRRAHPNHRGKKCLGKCQERLTFKSFRKNVTKHDGLSDYCKDCEDIYRQGRKHILDKFLERHRILSGNYRNYRRWGWQQRYAQLRKTGKIDTLKMKKARKDRENLRLVWGYLAVCKPRKKKKCPVPRPEE